MKKLIELINRRVARLEVRCSRQEKIIETLTDAFYSISQNQRELIDMLESVNDLYEFGLDLNEYKHQWASLYEYISYNLDGEN